MSTLSRVLAAGATLVLVGAVGTTPASAAERDRAGLALNVIPSGQPGSVPVPDGADGQAKLYDALTPLRDKVTPADLLKTFKDASFGTTGACPCRNEVVPRPGVKIVRDKWDVPHVTGRTRDDITWATGWILQQDRALILALGRNAARFAALDVPGVDAFRVALSGRKIVPSKEADAIIDKEQTTALRAAGTEGRQLLHDIKLYVMGLNARRLVDEVDTPPYTRVDVYALNALVGQIFGQGGGDEARRSEFLSRLQAQLGKANGTAVFDDLSVRDDRDAPVTIGKRFPYEQVPKGAGAGNAQVDAGSLDVIAARSLTALKARSAPHASNFLILSGKRSSTGHPLFLGGPQIGYFYPGLTLEMDLHGPGIDARGAVSPGGVGNVLIGRGPDSAWTLTSAGSDTNDIFAEQLCGGSSEKYTYKGRCLTMGTVNAGTLDGKDVTFRTTVHGPVLGRATSGGKPIALSFARSSRGRDILWQLLFSRLSQGKVTDPASFNSAAATSPFTFNVGFANDEHIATYSAGRLPLRAKQVDPRLPTLGTGAYDWKGFLAAGDHAHSTDPPSGELINWNNLPAPGFGPSDSQWTYGSIQRVQMLQAGVAKRKKHTPASLTGAMNAAATMDLRASGTMLKALNKVLRSGPAPSARESRMVDALMAWRKAGSSRVDVDLDGKMDAGGAPAIMDTVYPLIADAVLAPVLGEQNALLTAIAGKTNAPASGFTGGRLAYVDKDLRQLVGEKLKSPLKTRLCGNGDLAACRASLWAAFVTAGDTLTAAQGTADPAAWTSDATAERITFVPGILKTTIRYTNRPSGIQQLMSFTSHRPKP